ncbi:MAG TPA: glycosyltransferase [Actinomycetota bacterium]
MDASEPRLFGIVPTFRRPEELAVSLRVSADQSRPLDVLYVVDNSDLPENERAVASYVELGHAAHYLRMPENRGPAGAIAFAMDRIGDEASNDDWIVLLDDDDPLPDRSILADLLASGREMLARDRRLAAVGVRGAIMDWRRARLLRVDGSEAGYAAVDYLWSNWAPFYRVGPALAVGGYASELFFGFEELEFGLRLRAAGYSLYVFDANRRRPRPERNRTPDPKRGLDPLDWRRYYSLRNLIHILRTNGYSATAARVALVRGIGKPLANLPVTPRLALAHLRRNLAAIDDGWRGRLGRTLEPDGSRRAMKTSIDASLRGGS